MTRLAWITLGAIVLVVAVAVAPAFSQQGDQQGPPPLGMGPGGPMGGPPPAAQAVVVVADGVVYVAAEGKIIAYEAKTLRKLAEATYADTKARDTSKRGGHGAGGEATAPAGPPAN